MVSTLSKIRVIVLLLSVLCFASGCSTLLFREKKKFIQYPVQRGDTLFAISNRFDIPAGTIADVNDIDNPRALRVGQVLKVPYKGQNLTMKPGERSSARASYGGLSVRGSTSDRSNLSKMQLGRAKQYVGRLRMPASGGSAHISSRFGRRWLSFHEGIDIAGPVGTPVVAAHAGTVVYSGSSIRGYGNMVVVKGDGLITIYGHNKSNTVSVGDKVGRGERIAKLGMSGKATGPHVHFETRVKNSKGRYVAVDPLVFFQ